MDATRNYASWVPVESSNLARVIWWTDPVTDQSCLDVQFHSGKIARYFNVQEDVYKGLLGAQSKGKFHHHVIKNRYDFKYVS